MSTLTLSEFELIIDAAKSKCEQMGVKLSISVVDPRGDLIVMARMDGAPWRSPTISRGKALASACWGMSSADMADRAQSSVFQGFMALQDGNFIPGQGALPVYRYGTLAGAVGGSGGAVTGGRRRRPCRHRSSGALGVAVGRTECESTRQVVLEHVVLLPLFRPERVMAGERRPIRRSPGRNSRPRTT